MARAMIAAKKTKTPRDLEVVTRFIQVYCRAHHHTGDELCVECHDLLSYATQRLERCPHDPKPKCRDCASHCYAPKYRDEIKQVMRFSGIYFVKRGRVDWLIKYFL